MNQTVTILSHLTIDEHRWGLSSNIFTLFRDQGTIAVMVKHGNLIIHFPYMIDS
jgi:hypothetical protein